MNKVYIVVLSVFLAACGGGGSGSGSSSPENEPSASSNNEAPETPEAEDDPSLIPVSGLYDTSTAEDEAYLYISQRGNVVAYDYQGDLEGTGENCYSLATEQQQTNSGLHGGTITFSEVDDRYTITKGELTLSFDYDTVNGMRNFLINNAISIGGGIINGDPNLHVGGDSKLQTSSIAIEDIESMICS